MSAASLHVTPANDPAALARACSTLLSAAATILEQTLPALDTRARDGIDVALANAGTLCVESSTDAVHATRVVLTVVTGEGRRFELAAVSAPDRPAAPGAR